MLAPLSVRRTVAPLAHQGAWPGASLRRLVGRAGEFAAGLWSRLARCTPELLFALLLVLFLLGFFLTLVLEPGAVGRGGR